MLKWKKDRNFRTPKSSKIYRAKVSIFYLRVKKEIEGWSWLISTEVFAFTVLSGLKSTKRKAEDMIEIELGTIAEDIIRESQEFMHIEYAD